MGEPDPERGGRLAKFGMWGLRSDHGIGASPDDHVRRILAQISSDPSPWHFDLKQFNKDLFFGGWMNHWNTCFSMNGDVLLERGSRGIPINFDLYAEDDGDDDPESQRVTAEP
jgi:hypothetical protein